MTANYFIGHYEDRAKADALFAAAGLDPEGDGYFDIAHSREANTSKRFDKLEDATAWVSKHVADEHTVFGVGSIVEIEIIPPRKQCKYCTCDGTFRLRRHNVEETGIVETFDDEDECAS